MECEDNLSRLERELRQLRQAQDEDSWVDDTNRRRIEDKLSDLTQKVEVLAVLVDSLVKHTKLPAPPLQPKTVPNVKAACFTTDLQETTHISINLWLEYAATDNDILKLLNDGTSEDLVNYFIKGEDVYIEELQPLYKHAVCQSLNGNDVEILMRVGIVALEQWVKINKPNLYPLCGTTTEYWDCECEHDYIHPNTEDKCDRCGAIREEQPNSRKVEVANYLKSQHNATEHL